MALPLFHADLPSYLDSLVPTRPPEMVKMEQYAHEHKFPIIGPAAGYHLYLLARLINAKQIYELGSGYGYSTAWFAKAVRENIQATGGTGKVHHVVWDQKLSDMARQHLQVLGYSDLIDFHVGEAVQAMLKTTGPFDLVFNDINKDGYPASIPVIRQRLRTGGLLLIDNMLWHGRLFDPNDQAKETLAIKETTRLLTTDPGWIASIVPIRDGVIVAQKVG